MLFRVITLFLAIAVVTPVVFLVLLKLLGKYFSFAGDKFSR